MRLFIAFELPGAIQQDIQGMVERIQTPIDKIARMRWVGRAQFHVTLKFLGHCEEKKVSPLLEVLRALVCHHPGFDIQFQGLGCFPLAGTPHVVWLGITQGEAKIHSLVAAIENGCEFLGFPKENRPFNAHLSLGRIKLIRKAGELRSFLEIAATTSIGPVLIHQVSLMQSHLTAGGPHYETLETINLAAQ